MAKAPSISDILADVAKKNGLKIGSLSDVVDEIEWLSTGNLGINYVSGSGLPLGRSIELYGPPSSGKTTTGLQAAAKLQRDIIAQGRDDYILYLDFEHALDAEYAKALGLDVEHDSFLLAQPHSMEQGAEAALALIATGKVRLSIWDSVAAMAPIARLEGEFDQRTAAMNKARLMAGLMLQLTPLLHKHTSTAIFINHLMESVEMGGRPGMPPKVSTPGGKALKYYASVRLEYRQIKNIKGKAVDALSGESTDQAVATIVKVKCVKNKVAPPFRECEVRVRFGQGFDDFWSALQVLLAHKKVVLGTAGRYFFDEKKVPTLVHADMSASETGRPTVRGEAALLAFADSRPDWRAEAVRLAVELVNEHGTDALETGSLSDEDEVTLNNEAGDLFEGDEA